MSIPLLAFPAKIPRRHLVSFRSTALNEQNLLLSPLGHR